MAEQISVLVVEDDARLRASIVSRLRHRGLQVAAVDSGEEALVRIAAARPQLLLLDVRLGGMSGVDLVRQLAGESSLPLTIVVSGEASISETVEALQLGVHDFIEKPFSPERLEHSIDNALAHRALEEQVAELRSELAGAPPIIGRSQAIEELRAVIARAAAAEATVVITGESGTGKELVADAFHRASRRHDRPYVRLNCAAIPAQLVEDELFGHVRGAFTDASATRAGLFEAADGGVLFLDEIGDMPGGLQSRLLRVLEDGRVRRIGESEDRRVDVRVIAATNRDLEEEVRAGRFRQDLYFRIARLVVRVPPLRERGDDVVLLFHHFVAEACRHNRLPSRRIGDGVDRLLLAHGWPGNVRELKNLCERLVVFGGDPVGPEQVASQLAGELPRVEKAGITQTGSGTLRLDEEAGDLTLRELRARCEREYIEAVLRRTDWNVAAAARILGLQRTYLHDKMSQLGIVRPGNALHSDG